MDPSKFLRAQLASVGILLDEPVKPVRQVEQKQETSEPVDRDLIREILVAAGAPARDLDWMVSSCPGVEYALTYRPTIREAWCVRCGGAREADLVGCVGCREQEHGFRPSLGPEHDE